MAIQRGRVWASLGGCLFLAACLSCIGQVFAQSPGVRLPPAAEPRSQPPPTEAIPPQPSPEIETRPDTQVMPPRAHEIKFEFKGVRLLGGSVYAAHELEPYYSALIGTNISLARVYQIARDIQERYRADGYLLTRVVIPRQTVTDYVFDLRIVEGYVAKVRVEGDTGAAQDRIQTLLQKVTQHRPVNRRELERYLLLINDLPGIEARGLLRPTAGEIGASELVLRVDRQYFDGFAVINNRGSRFTGPWRGMLVNRTYSLLGLGEGLELLVLASQEAEQQYVSLTYNQPAGSEGHTIGLAVSYGPSEPGHTLAPLAMESEVAHLGLSSTHPWVRSRSRNLFSTVGFAAVNSDVDLLDEPFSRDRLRVLYASGDYDFVDKRGGYSRLGLTVRKGFPILGATSDDDPLRSRTEGKSDFTSIRFHASTHQPLFDVAALNFAVKAQYAFDTLLSDEEFRLGGEQFGRGYDPSELAGEHGLGWSLELQRNVSVGAEALSEYQLYGFYDGGIVWNEDTGSRPRESLASVGIGVRGRFYESYSIGLELAKPLTREVAAEGNKDLRLYLQLSAHY